MTLEPICEGCTSFIDGKCARSILPLRKTERVPECFTADPESMAATYYEGAQLGYEAIDAALATMSNDGFTDEQPLFKALNAGVATHVTDLSDENLHPLAGFLAGAANRIREALNPLPQTSPETQTN